MGREVVRISEDGTRSTFKSVNAAAMESGIPPTTLKRYLLKGCGTLRGFSFQCEGPSGNEPAAAVEGGSAESAVVTPAPPPPAPIAVQQNTDEDVDHDRVASELFAALKTDDGRLITEMRNDGYVNATKMCHSAGKSWGDFYRLNSTASFLEALDKERTGQSGHAINVPLLADQSTVAASLPPLVRSRASGPYAERGTWVHPDVAVHLASWCSPYFAVKVSQLVRRFVTGKVTTQESQAAARMAPDFIEQSRKRKLDMDEAEFQFEQRKKIYARNHEVEMSKIDVAKAKSDVEALEMLEGLAGRLGASGVVNEIKLASINLIRKATVLITGVSSGSGAGPSSGNRITVQEMGIKYGSNKTSSLDNWASVGKAAVDAWLSHPGHRMMDENPDGTWTRTVKTNGARVKTVGDAAGIDFDVDLVRFSNAFGGRREITPRGTTDVWTYPDTDDSQRLIRQAFLTTGHVLRNA